MVHRCNPWAFNPEIWPRMHLEHFIAATLPFSRPNETNFDFEKVRRGMVVMHGRDLARESMMNNDGGAMEEAPCYESIGIFSSLGEISCNYADYC